MGAEMLRGSCFRLGCVCEANLREGTTMTVKVDEVEALGKFVMVSLWCFGTG